MRGEDVPAPQSCDISLHLCAHRRNIYANAHARKRNNPRHAAYAILSGAMKSEW